MHGTKISVWMRDQVKPTSLSFSRWVNAFSHCPKVCVLTIRSQAEADVYDWVFVIIDSLDEASEESRE